MKYAIALLCTILVLVSSSFAAEKFVPFSTELIDQIESRISREIVRQRIPGMSVAIGVDNQLRFANGFGQSDVENSVPARAVTVYRTASIAKPMTSAVVMHLAETGKLDLDAPLRKYFGDFPKKQWPVTSRQLLGHLGGIRHYKSSAEATGTKHFFNVQAPISLFANDPLLHEPGTKFRYSTYGYNLLGAVAERIAGKSFIEQLTEVVITPAGMLHTRVDDHFAVIPNRSRGYIRPTRASLLTLYLGHNFKAGQLYNAQLHDTSMKIPGGGLVSTAPDLVRFAMAMDQHGILRSTTVRDVWTRQHTKDSKRTSYGLGWSVSESGGQKFVSHGGGQAGTATYLLLIPDSNIYVAVMCNLQGARLATLAKSLALLVDKTKASTTTNTTSTRYQAIADRMRKAIKRELEQKQIPALSIALVDDDRIVWAEGFGIANPVEETPANADTVYRVGSISKLFTDIAVMQLVEQGKLDLDRDIGSILKDFKPKNPFKTKMTLRQLMSHRAGLVRESPVGNYFDPTEPTLAATVRSLNQTTMVYPSGSRTKYSNTGIAVAGYIVERAMNTPFDDYMRDRILRPLGMHHSDYTATAEIKKRLARGWMWTVEGRRFEAPTFGLGISPAGNLYSSVTDLGKFLTILFNDGKLASGQLLKPKTLQQMMTPQPTKDGAGQFGIGFAVSNFDGHKAIGHGGAVYGYSTQLKALPEQKLGVVAVASLDGSNGCVRRLSDYALRLMLALKKNADFPDYQTTQPVPLEIARSTVGRYQNNDATIELSERDGRLLLHQGAYQKELRSLVDSLVVDDVLGYGPKVRVRTRDELLIGNRKWERIEDTKPADSPKRWSGLIGEYGWDHNILYILEDRGQLYALIEWFYYYPLTELSRDEFAFPDYGLYHGEKLIFKRKDNGEAKQVVAASVTFPRRVAGPSQGETFRIKPVKPIEQIRPAALAAKPPRETGNFLKPDLVDVTNLDATIKLDIRYATDNNFMGVVFYKQPRAFLQRSAAEAVVRVHRRLKQRGLGLLIHDAYRPWFVTKMFWDATPENLKDFVANPQRGSRHNRGSAVDLTLYRLDTGRPVNMVAGYDEFSPRAFPAYPGGTSRQRWYRELLRHEMQLQGFTIYQFEWWHFDFKDWKRYPILNKTFEEVDSTKE